MNYIQTCKTQIATVLTNKGVETSDQETLETMAANIAKACDNYYQIGKSDASTVILKAMYNSNTITILNQTGAELPSTGGIGTTLFYVAGTIMMFGAAVSIYSRKREEF